MQLKLPITGNDYLGAFLSGASRGEIAARFHVTPTTVCNYLNDSGKSPRRCVGCGSVFWLPLGSNGKKSWCPDCHNGTRYPGAQRWAKRNRWRVVRTKRRTLARAWLENMGTSDMTLRHSGRVVRERTKGGNYLYLIASDLGSGNWGIGITSNPDKRLRDYNSQGDGVYDFAFCGLLPDTRWLEGVIKFVLINGQSKPGHSAEWFVTDGMAARIRGVLAAGDVDSLRSLLVVELERIAKDGTLDGISAVN